MLDRVLGDDELVGETKPSNLDFQQCVDRFGDLVLKLAGAENADPALSGKEHRKPGGIP